MNRCYRSTSRSSLPRSGFALMTVLIVIMTTSLIMLGMYQSLHLQTSESLARQRVVVNRSLSTAAAERAVAMLLSNPGYEGDSKFETPPGSGRVSVLSIYPSKVDKELIDVTATLYVDNTETTITRTIARSDLDRRRKELGL